MPMVQGWAGPRSERGYGDNGHRLPLLGTGVSGRRDQDPEPRQSLCSSTEFLAGEPAESQGQGSKPNPVSLTLFKGALSAEQEREKEPVGAGR